MKYILEFENWVSAVKEGFDAKIEDDEDTKDEIEIEAPNEDNIIKYVVDKDDNVKSKKIISTDNGEQEEENIVNDKHLENDIIDAVDKINDIKDRVEAEELRRLTGGDRSTDSATVKQIKKIFKDNNNGNPEYICNYDGFMSFLKGTSESNLFHLDISNIKGKYNINKENVYSNFKPKKGVGKGEYLLPLLFDDVYKQKIHGENTKGDNFIVHSENNELYTYYLELKAPNASLGFKKNIRDYIEKELLKDNIEKEEIYKNSIVASIMKYAKNLKSSWENLYLCIFSETNSPKDILFINFSEIEENDIEPTIDTNRTSLFKEIFDMIAIDNIDDYNTSKRKGKIKKDIAYSFSFTYNHDENKIYCKLKSETIQDIHNESYEQ
jgi:hypothetical protein